MKQHKQPAGTKIVVVTRKTRLEQLVERHNTKSQAAFYVRQNRQDFSDYEREDAVYRAAVSAVMKALEGLPDGRGATCKVQPLDRGFLPAFLFEGTAAVVVVGQDGLVANAAKYVDGRPMIGVNPDPARFDGVLLPFRADSEPQVLRVREAAMRVLADRAACHRITMAEATTNDGQRILGFNDLLIGRRDHVSARYGLRFAGKAESQSSSGILVTTGAGSTGWAGSVRQSALAMVRLLTGKADFDLPHVTMKWEDPRLLFAVREPYLSRATGVTLAAGYIGPDAPLVVESHMPEGGVIFGDGMDPDALTFTSGTVATIRPASVRALLVRP
jgi:NAD kinase